MTTSLPSKGTDTVTTKITQFAQGDPSHCKVNVHRGASRSERAPSPTYVARIEYIQGLSTALRVVGYDHEGTRGSDSGARGGV
jgi:hypothetical protein